MRVHSEYDFLLDAKSTRDVYAQHVHDGSDDVALVRAALREDARVQVRRNAIVALSASLKERGVPDYIYALDDPASEVRAEGAASLANYVAATMQPVNNDALTALKTHASGLRAALASDEPTTRYNAARVLRLIGDPKTDLATLLRDDSPLVRSEGLSLVATRSLGPSETALLDSVARTDSDAALRARAVTLVAAKAPPKLAVPIVSAALGRNDVDRSTADAVRDARLTGVLSAILDYLRGRPYRTEWLNALMSFRPPCAAQLLAQMMADATSGHAAEEALRTLSGHREWSATQLEAWAKAQPADVVPCAGPR